MPIAVPFRKLASNEELHQWTGRAQWPQHVAWGQLVDADALSKNVGQSPVGGSPIAVLRAIIVDHVAHVVALNAGTSPSATYHLAYAIGGMAFVANRLARTRDG